MKRLSTFLITAAVIAGMTACAAPSVQYNLAISSTAGGSVTTPGEGTFAYDEGEVVDLVVTPDTGYEFVNWTGDVDDIADVEDATTTIIMNDDYSITAGFAVKQYDLTVSSTEGGSVITPGEGTYTYDGGTTVDLIAQPDEGYQFMKWTGSTDVVANIYAAETTITINHYCSITANFAVAICDWYDLDTIRDNLGGSYILMNDLDSTTAGYVELASPTANEGQGWRPIGSIFVEPFLWPIANLVDPFTGSFDGQGYEIRDLFINRPDEDGVGLFGCVGGGHIIKNLGVVNADVNGHIYVGSLVGENHEGTVVNSYSTGSISGDEVVGGLVGQNDGTVSNSYSTGSVTADCYAGGLLGTNYFGTVSNSYSTVNTVGEGNIGGLVGANWGTVNNSYSTGSVFGEGGVGGLVGWQEQGTVTNSYSTGSVTGYDNVGGLVGWIGLYGATVSNSYYNYDGVLINGQHIITIGALSNEDFDQWLANDRFLDVNERLSQEDGYYLINDVDDFKSLLAFGQDGALKFRLINDLDLSDEPNLYIPCLAGEFDGNGRKIANLSVSSDFIWQVGLFGYLASGGVVTGVGAENVNITGPGIVGGLVGENDGTISDSYATGRVAGSWSVGGLVGWMGWYGGTVSNSYYNYDEVLINQQHIITIGALSNEDFDQWLTNDKFLDVNERLSQEDGYYLISDASDFKQLLAFGQDDSLKFKVENDLDLGGEPNFYVPYLAGEFDGNGHKVRNLSLHFDFVALVGLFGYVDSCGKVSSLGVENANVTVTNGQRVGGLVGWNEGTVSNSYSTGSVTGQWEIGGLVGWNGGTVGNSSSTGSVTGYGDVGGLVGHGAWQGTVSSSYSTGSVSGGNHAGGLVGVSDGTVSDSYSSSSVTGEEGIGGLVGISYGTVRRSYSTGTVNGVYAIGGLIGAWSYGTVNDSVWDIVNSGIATSDGGTGKTTTEMKSIATFVGAAWDIIAVANEEETNPTYTWNIVDGETYPFLSWQSVS